MSTQAPAHPVSAIALPDSTTPRGRARQVFSPGNPRLVLWLILSVQLMVMLDATIVNIALNDIKGSLHFSTASLSWVINAYTLTFGGLLLLGARAGDLLGRRRVFVAGLSIFTLASLAGGFAQHPAELLAARAAQGLGAALASPAALALLLTAFPQGRERVRAIGLYTAVSVGGAAVGLIAGGILTEWASWRWVLFVNVPIGAAAVFLGRRVLPETARTHGRFDLAGALTSTVGVTALVYGFVHAAESGWSSAETVGSFGIGLALLAAFIGVELRAEAPITPLHLFADRNRSTSYLARLFLVGGMFGIFFFLTQFLHGVLGYSNLQTGFAFVPLSVAVFASSQLSARYLVEWLGSRRVMMIGLTTSTLGLLWLTQLSETSGYLSLLGPLLLFGAGNGLSFVPLTTAALDGVGPADAGAASGLVNVMQQVGGSLGLAVLVTVFGTFSADAASEPANGRTQAEIARHVFTVAADKSFWVATGFLLTTLLLVTFVIRKPEAKKADAGPQAQHAAGQLLAAVD